MRVNPLTPERKSKRGEGGGMRGGYGRRGSSSMKRERDTHTAEREQAWTQEGKL